MIRVEIVDPDHPHAGERGELRSKRTVMKGRMMLVVLENCVHLTENCYVEKNQIKVI